MLMEELVACLIRVIRTRVRPVAIPASRTLPLPWTHAPSCQELSSAMTGAKPAPIDEPEGEEELQVFGQDNGVSPSARLIDRTAPLVQPFPRSRLSVHTLCVPKGFLSG